MTKTLETYMVYESFNDPEWREGGMWDVEGRGGWLIN